MIANVKMLHNAVACGSTEPLALGGIIQYAGNVRGELRDVIRVNEYAVYAGFDDLTRAGGFCHENRFSDRHRFCDCKPKTFALRHVNEYSC